MLYLFRAAQYGHLEVVKYLVSKGARSDIPTILGTTPFEAAMQKRHHTVAQFLATTTLHIMN